MLIVTLAILTGLFAGLCAGLIYLHIRDNKIAQDLRNDRMLLLNKSFVRDGQAPLYPAAVIADELGIETPEPRPARTISNPFHANKIKAMEEAERADEPVSNLPPESQSFIRQVAAKFKA